jgi:hypothetical protein
VAISTAPKIYKMKKLISVLFFTFCVVTLSAQNNLQSTKATEKSFPTNLNHENFSTLEKLNGKIVAFDGTIEKVENSRNNTPFYKLRVGDSSYLWTVLMFKNETNKTGDTIRVVGYLTQTPTDANESEKQYLDGKYMGIAFGLVDFKNSNFLFASSAGKQKKEWIDGKIPSSK